MNLTSLLFIHGPALGLTTGIVKWGTATTIWLILGQPDFYFRGWQGVWVEMVLDCIIGAAGGLGFGAVLFILEKLFGMEVSLHQLRRVMFFAALSVYGRLRHYPLQTQTNE